ncbi:MAG: hypothetical protein JO002_06975 [Burkholderiaceae bacterium]|nr:hypothetical protein [Burkholderiaceae bacterium]
MKVDIYKRPEIKGQFSFMAVPEGKAIPEEVTNSDWEIVSRGREFDNPSDLGDLPIENPREQIQMKGYAITSSRDFTK